MKMGAIKWELTQIIYFSMIVDKHLSALPYTLTLLMIMIHSEPLVTQF